MFIVHKNRHPSRNGAMWGWVERDGKDVAIWTSWRDQPAPGCAPGARVERYVDGFYWTPSGAAPDWRHRIVDASDRPILASIADHGTACELLAWLCPKE